MASPRYESAAARAAGLQVMDVRLERLWMAFFDIGAVVYFLRKVIWIVPGSDIGLARPKGLEPLTF